MYKYIGSLTVDELNKIDTKLTEKVQKEVDKFKEKEVDKFKDKTTSYWIDVMVNENDDIVLVSDNGLECSTDIKINKKLIDSIVKVAVEV